VFRLDRRIIPEESGQAAEEELRALLADAARSIPGIRVNVQRILLAQPFRPRAGQERLVEALRRHAAAIFQVDAKPHGVPLYTDARHYSAAGVPTVLYGAGPRTLEEARGHRADENLLLEDLHRASAVVALACAELLSSG
jgi:acetylornithine deacetylase/succinyl-diaminopimelate desuccinylase-like protein